MLQFVGVSAARALGLGEHAVCLIRLGGNEAVVAAQLNGLSQIAEPEEVESRIWNTFRELDGDADSVVRISSLPVRFLGTSAKILSDDFPNVYTSIDPGRGVMRIVVGANLKDGEQSGIEGSDDSYNYGGASSEIIFEQLPPEVWAHVSPSVVADPLSQGIKKAYDPHNILNPGILGD